MGLKSVAWLCLTAVWAVLGQPEQTQWQRALFKKVSLSAAERSSAAVPELVAYLGEASFRTKLAECCPEMSRLSAEELLQRLQQETRVMEVVSGFSAEVDPMRLKLGVEDMNLEDGISGSHFESLWEATLRHNLSFTKPLYQSTIVECGESGAVKLQTWIGDSCDGPPIQDWSMSPGECISPGFGQYIRFRCSGSNVSMLVWTNASAFESGSNSQWAQLRHPRWLRASGPPGPPMVACPAGPPDVVKPWPVQADGQCHSQVSPWSMWGVEDAAELQSYKLKPFAKPAAPISEEEVKERAPYTMVNHFLLDAGSPVFGPISAVFSAKAIRRTALLSGVDTGLWTSMCGNGTGRGGGFPGLGINCSAYVPFEDLGTMDHFNHLFLVNEKIWGKQLNALLSKIQRLEGAWGSHPMSFQAFLSYWEALPAGTLRYPEDVRFLIGSFPELFGSAMGRRLQQWAVSRGWLLVWSLGLNTPRGGFGPGGGLDPSMSAACNQRLVDPAIAQQTSARGSLPLTSSAVAAFEARWASVAALRQGNVTIANTTWAQMWKEMGDELGAGLRLSPLRAGSCERPEEAPECVGISAEGSCVCYSEYGGMAVLAV